MIFPDTIYLVTFVAALLGSGLTMPLWMRWCTRNGLMDDPGHRKIHHQPVALAGGWGVLTGLIVPVAAGLLVFGWIGGVPGELSAFSYGVQRRLWELLGIVAAAVGMVLLGWLDDRHELKAAPKFAGQCGCAVLAAMAGAEFPLFPGHPWLQFGLTLLWILTVTNAMNFMDNMNGLCGGLSLISSFGFAMRAAAHGQYLVATLGFAVCGAILGFLPYNYPKARAFLGDTGSHLLGFLLSILPLISRGSPQEMGGGGLFLAMVLILAVPLVDLVWVVVIRHRLGKPFYIGDNNHLSHRLVRGGLTPREAVLRIWLFAAAAVWLAGRVT